MAKANSIRRKAAPSPSAKIARRQEAERRQAKLLALREEARNAVKEPPVPANLLADTLGVEGTLENVHTVMKFLECSELVDDATTAEAEEGRWRIQQWPNDALEFAQAQREREHKIDTLIIGCLHSGGAQS